MRKIHKKWGWEPVGKIEGKIERKWNKQRLRQWKRIGALGTALALVAGTFSGLGVGVPSVSNASAATNYGLSNPRVEMQTRDVIEFGSYWQEDTNGDGVADQKDEKTPIKWQIIKQDGNDLFLLADQVLDCKPYNNENGVTKTAYDDEEGTYTYTDYSCTWETSSLRKWLNNDFYEAAFSESEKEAVKQTNVVNEDNPYYDTEGGNDTTDKLFLFSLSEITNENYGFLSERYFWDQARHGKATAYAKAQGCSTTREGTSWWWLRSPGRNSRDASSVYSDGCVNSYGYSVIYDYVGVRPALHLNAANAAISAALANKTTEEVALAKSTWDTVEFGTYNGVKIQWRVLSVDGDDAFLLADRILLRKAYNENGVTKTVEDDEDGTYTYTTYSCTWETSSLRKWLNDDFYKEAFTSEEQAAIKKTTVINEDNPYYGTEGGNNTEDSIYLLSLSDIVNKSYGFPTSYWCDSASRQAVPTNSEDTSWWWLRSPGLSSDYAANVRGDGYVTLNGHDVDDDDGGVRPALHLNLSSSVWKKGEVVTSEDKKTEITETLPSGTSSTPTPDSGSGSGSGNGGAASTPSSTATPTAKSTEQATATSSAFTGTSTAATSTALPSSDNANGDNSAADTGITSEKVKSLKVQNQKKGKAVVTFKEVTGASGYQIQYAKNKKFTKSKKSKTTKKTKYTIKKLTKKKTYYFRVRAYAIDNGEKKFGKWSAVKKLKVKK